MINPIKGNQTVNRGYIQNDQSNVKKTDIEKTAKVEPVAKKEDKVAIIEINNRPPEKLTYSKPKGNVDTEEINKLKAEAEKSYKTLQDIVKKLIMNQGEMISKKDPIIIDSETKAWAQEAISEDGEFGIKAVSDNLVSFAKALAGNDKLKAEELKSAITKGFQAAEKAFGGKLPEISYKTYDETMRKMDEWINSED